MKGDAKQQQLVLLELDIDMRHRCHSKVKRTEAGWSDGRTKKVNVCGTGDAPNQF
jgi:hypothetical protein